MAEQDRLTVLYEWSEAMTKAGDAVKEKHAEDYKKIIDYVKTSENSKERVMAAQIIARFFKYFPELEHEAFDSIVDLCESADVDVRKHATMTMITICRGSKQVVSKAADILIQLYQTNQPSEVNLINQSLATLLNLNIEQFLKSFFANFDDGSELVRERALKFLVSKIHTVAESSLTKEIEEQLMNYTKKAMDDVTKDEFISFIGILSKLKIAKTSSGQAALVAAIKSQAEMGNEFNVKDKDFLDKFLLCTRHTIPFLSQYNRASEYINFICLKVLPHLAELAPNGNDLNVLQVLAEMSPHVILDDVPSLIDLDQCHKAVQDKLLEYLPQPPEIAPVVQAAEANAAPAVSTVPSAAKVVEQETPKANEAEAKAAAEAESTEQTSAGAKEGESNQADQSAVATATAAQTAEKTTAMTTTATPSSKAAAAAAQEVDFQFTHIEYLLYTFIQLCRLKPELYTEAMQVANRKKLYHLSNGCKKYTDALQRQLTSVKRTDLNKEENKLRSIALRTTKNISTMVLGLFKRPADFKTSITLSCKPVRVESTPPAGANGNESSTTSATSAANKSHMKPKHGGVYVAPNQRGNNNGGGHQRSNSGGYNSSSNNNNNNQRQVGQKSKFRGNYQSSDNRGKRPRHAR